MKAAIERKETSLRELLGVGEKLAKVRMGSQERW